MLGEIECPECGKAGITDIMVGLVDDVDDLRDKGAPACCSSCGAMLRVKMTVTATVEREIQ